MNETTTGPDILFVLKQTKAEMIPKIPWRLRAGYGVNYLSNYFFSKSRPLNPEIVDGLKQNLRPLGKAQFRELPRFKVEDITPRVFQDAIRESIPFVIENLLGNADMLNWNVDYLDRHIGKIEVPIHQLTANGYTSGEINRKGTFHEVFEDMRLGLGARKYIDNVSDVFDQCPQLMKDIPLDRLKQYMARRFWGQQLFLGGKETGSRFHCASQCNLFIMVDGIKNWLFAHPRASVLFQPRMNPYGIYSYSDVYDLHTPDEQAQTLFDRIPLLRTSLAKGDVLLNPPWWWHSVKNATAQTIAMATRWEAPYFLNDNWFYSIIQFLTPHQIRLWLHLTLGGRLKDSMLKLKIRER